MKKCFVLLMSVMLVLAMIPAVAFAEQEVTWEDLRGTRVGSVITADEAIAEIMNNGSETILLKFEIYEDSDYQIPYEFDNANYAKEIEIVSHGSGAVFTPVTAKVDQINVSQGEGDKTVLEYVLVKAKWYSDSTFDVDSVYLDPEIYMQNLCDESITIITKVYSDNNLTQLIDDDDDGCTSVKTVSAGESEGLCLYYGGAKFVEMIDETDGSNPVITFKFYDSKADLSSTQKADLVAFEKELEYIFGNSKDSYTIKIADPSKLGIEGWTEEEAVGIAFSSEFMYPQLNVEDNIYEMDGEKWINADFMPSYYYDKDLTQPVAEESPMEANKTYYMDAKYKYSYEWYLDGLQVGGTVSKATPIEVKVEIVDVDAGSNELTQIKNIVASGKGINIVYDDLAPVNLRIIAGKAINAPKVGYASAMLKERNAELYNELVGDTKLEITTVLTQAGGPTYTGTERTFKAIYHVGEIYYYFGGSSFANKVCFDNIIYVAEGTNNKAEAAEKRINDYLRGGNYTAEVEEFSPEALAVYMIKNDSWLAQLGITKSYMTQKGVFSYDSEGNLADAREFDAEHLSDVFSKHSFELTGQRYSYETYDYEQGNWVQAEAEGVKVYKVTLTDDKGNAMEYMYFIEEADKMDEPYAEWKDPETNIITKGENGYIPVDAYTKIRVIQNGEEIKFIRNKVGADKEVQAFNINAFTNFKGELKDLGDGLMKIMIPIGKIKEDVKAHYVDEDGNVQNLTYTIEEVEGQKYVCFIVSHFSVYAISGLTEDSIGTDAGGNSSNPPETSDNSGIGVWMLVALLGLAGAVVFKRKTVN